MNCGSAFGAVLPAGGDWPFPLRYAAPEPHLVKKSTFPTPQDAEAAFYEALEAGELGGMMGGWAGDEESGWGHPGGARRAGYGLGSERWAQSFCTGQRVHVYVSNLMV